MQKEFNDTGLCVPERHYMVDIIPKITRILPLIEKGKYFTINRPRQFGKTTTLALLAKTLNQRPDYCALQISFEGLDAATYAAPERFIYEFLMLCLDRSARLNFAQLAQMIEQHLNQIQTIPALSRLITKLAQAMEHATPPRALVLLIDEVDKSLNNQLFLDFLGMLRHKYLQRNDGQDETFQAVILAGVHDVKTLKAKIRPDAEQKFNSPWNIAVDFTIDLSFQPEEIATMLQAYQQEKPITMDIPAIAAKLYYYTSGYPYLVSKMCKFIDETILPARSEQRWSVGDVEDAFKLITKESYTTTLFDSLTKNLENNPDLYEMIFQISLNGETMTFTIADPIINLGHLYGILAEVDGCCRIHNRVYEQRIYAYMLSKFSRTQRGAPEQYPGPEFFQAGRLDLRLILQKFQEFMQEHSSRRDQHFLEREGRLLFLAFLKPIINGKGFEFKEPNVGDERRMDLVITCGSQRYVVELKRWYGPQAHQDGLRQLSDYLELYALKQGYLLIYDFNKHKEYKQETITVQEKQIFAVWV